MKIGIAIDKWKLRAFETSLRDAGFTWEQHEGIVADTWFLMVVTDDVERLTEVVANTNEACSSS